MGRSGYTEDGDDEYNQAGLWQANVRRATTGRRGQKFFRALLEALDALPKKELVEGELEDENGAVCALGAFRVAKGLSLDRAIAESDWDALGKAFAAAPLLMREVMFQNDDDFGEHPGETPGKRFERMRAWVAKQILPEVA